jgi:signal peptidase I
MSKSTRLFEAEGSRLAFEELRRLWKNEYFRTAVMILAMVGIVFGFWFGTQAVLRTDYPALAVASTSMLPTLNVGDLIIVQGTPADQINANYITGDIIVFRSPTRSDLLIVHRAVEKEFIDGVYYFTTHGDNNPTGSNEGPFPESYVIGRVIGKIPTIGNFALLIHSRENTYIFIIVLVILIAIFLIFPFGDEEKAKDKEGKKSQKGRKLFGKIDLGLVYLLIANILLVAFIVLNLWGAFTFLQAGADPPQNVTVHGMFPDIQFYGSFTRPFNDVQQVSVSQGFLTYAVDAQVSDGLHSALRPGVPTFSWWQAGIIILALLDGWELYKFLRARKKPEAETTTVASEA